MVFGLIFTNFEIRKRPLDLGKLTRMIRWVVAGIATISFATFDETQ
jgi:hypothetical protein